MKKLTRTQVKAILKKEGSWRGYLAGNKVNPFHINDGWHLGQEVVFHSLDEMEKEAEAMLLSLCVYTPELGNRVAFYET